MEWDEGKATQRYSLQCLKSQLTHRHFQPPLGELCHIDYHLVAGVRFTDELILPRSFTAFKAGAHDAFLSL